MSCYPGLGLSGEVVIVTRRPSGFIRRFDVARAGWGFLAQNSIGASTEC